MMHTTSRVFATTELFIFKVGQQSYLGVQTNTSVNMINLKTLGLSFHRILN